MTKSIDLPTNRQARQGDVLITPVGEVPAGAIVEKREGGRVIIAHGEATGHAHAFGARLVQSFRHEEGRYLRVGGNVAVVLKHEEHTHIRVPPGKYRIIRQRQHQRGAIAVVAD
jgi:hypothetical protein